MHSLWKNIEVPADFISCSVCNEEYHILCAETVETSRRGVKSHQQQSWKCRNCIKQKNNKNKNTANILTDNLQEQPPIVKNSKHLAQSSKTITDQAVNNENLPTSHTDGANQMLTKEFLFLNFQISNRQLWYLSTKN